MDLGIMIKGQGELTLLFGEAQHREPFKDRFRMPWRDMRDVCRSFFNPDGAFRKGRHARKRRFTR
jgi:hypothetical protein